MIINEWCMISSSCVDSQVGNSDGLDGYRLRFRMIIGTHLGPNRFTLNRFDGDGFGRSYFKGLDGIGWWIGGLLSIGVGNGFRWGRVYNNGFDNSWFYCNRPCVFSFFWPIICLWFLNSGPFVILNFILILLPFSLLSFVLLIVFRCYWWLGFFVFVFLYLLSILILPLYHNYLSVLLTPLLFNISACFYLYVIIFLHGIIVGGISDGFPYEKYSY